MIVEQFACIVVRRTRFKITVRPRGQDYMHILQQRKTTSEQEELDHTHESALTLLREENLAPQPWNMHS